MNIEMEAEELLSKIIESVGGLSREGQVLMANESAKTIQNGEHIVVSAGTGIGKSFAYISAALTNRGTDPQPVVIVTATKALQEQLVLKDLPVVSEVYKKELGRPLSFMKALGVSNFFCNLQAKDTMDKVEKGDYDLDRDDELILEWAKTTPTGDVSELSFEPNHKTWSNFSVGSGECLGRKKCPQAEGCFALGAKEKYQFADVIVANTALYAIYLQTGMNENILPNHDIVIFDECHKVPDSVRSAMSSRITKFSVQRVASTHASFFEKSDIEKDLTKLATRLEKQLEDRHNDGNSSLVRIRNLAKTEPTIYKTLELIIESVSASESRIAREIKANSHLEKLGIRGEKALMSIANFKDQVAALINGSDGDVNKVVWINKEKSTYSLNIADIDISDFLKETLWESPVSAILCSATVPPNLTKELGLKARRIDAPSPFDYRESAYLYIPKGMPAGNDRENFFEATLAPIEKLVRLTQGRTLLLFTSWKAMRETYEALESTLGKEFTMMMQGQKPKGLLVEEFRNSDKACLFGTQSFWEGISIDGDACVSVIIDKIPFSSPADPIFQAIREKAGDKAFYEVDIPHAATTLAQGVGRLIRTVDDKGIVTVLDSRLAEKNYRDKILNELPPLRRLRNYDFVEAFANEKLNN